MKGYKIFNPDFTCRGFEYKEGKTYTHKGNIELCEDGFHFCPQAQHCFNYYDFDSENIVCEVEAIGKVIKGDDKCVTDKIKIGKRLSWEEVLRVANTGVGNSGHSNSGHRNSGDSNSGDSNSGYSNSGDWNSGHRNSGDSNSGDSNSGYSNSGDWNSGHRNSGDRNSGHRNSGDRNSGHSNSGHRNSGYRNSGDRNSGNWNSGDSNSGNCNSGNSNSGDRNSGNSNSGDWNSGYRNSGNWNSGNCNSGNSNSGDRNSGYRNSGDWNSGNWNSGDWNSGYSNSGYRNSGDWNSGYSNSGDWNSGAFCSDTPKMRLFNKESDWTIGDFQDTKVYRLLIQVENVLWIPSSHMSKKEKEAHPEHETTGGYLKTISLKEAWKNAWGNWDKESRNAFKELPNFDAKIFEEITGIKI